MSEEAKPKSQAAQRLGAFTIALSVVCILTAGLTSCARLGSPVADAAPVPTTATVLRAVDGDTIDGLDFSDDVAIGIYEVPEVGAPRQWFMPAAVINDAVANGLAIVRQLTDTERDAAIDARRTELAALMQEETTE